MLNNKK